MTPCEGSEKVELGAAMHTMMLLGEVKEKGEVLSILKIKMDQKYGCVLNMQVRTLDPDISKMVMESLS